MPESSFDYEGALNEGYTDEEILDHLVESHHDFDVQGALREGYSSKEINEHLSSRKNPEPKKERGIVDKAARVAGQYALGALEATPSGMVYDLAVAPLASKDAQNVSYRENIGDEIEDLLIQKDAGVWSEKDQEHLDHLTNQIQNPEESEKFVKTSDIGIKGLASKATGIDFTPEGISEKSAHWAGFIKDPKKLFELSKTGLNAKDLTKAIFPSGGEAMRGAGAGIALQMAEEGNFGPIGTMAAAVLGDISGSMALKAAKGTKKILTNPREVIAEIATKFTKKDKIDLQKDIIKDFRESNIQADIGTLTDSDLVKWFQSRLAQSGLTGKALDELKMEMTSQIKEEYKALAESIGEARFSTTHEAGEVTKTLLKDIKEADSQVYKELYKNSDKALKKDASVISTKLFKTIEEVESKLKPGANKSSEQQIVLNELEKLKKDIYDAGGTLKFSDVKNLLNNKLGIQDVINYETQGGAKQLLKQIVSEIDRTIISHGKDNPTFAKNYIQANKKFSQHAKEFRNRRVAQFFKEGDPTQLMNKMNSVQGIIDLETILSKTPGGKEVMGNLKRFRLDRMIEDNLVDSTTQQIKLGTFSKLLEKGKNRDIAKELLPKPTLKRLERLQKNSGRLAESAQKFLNSSKSGVTLEDAGIVAKTLSDIGSILAGNPWPFLSTASGLVGARYLNKLMGDPSFLRLVEEMIMASENNNISLMKKLGNEMIDPIKAAIAEGAHQTNQDSNQRKK